MDSENSSFILSFGFLLKFPVFAPIIYNKVRARRILCSTMRHFGLRDATVEHKSRNCGAQNEQSRSTKWRTMEHKMRCRSAASEKSFSGDYS